MNLQPIVFEGLSNERPLIIAGPCSAETEEQTFDTAKRLSQAGIKIFRAGVWKPR
ncbi:MAG: 3-deoxy-7-phosphoheptulonate synthase, partial [Paludibacter sp.]|nr:3-deoxy-7-phosphoheptulonate synthase [Paludibacter sp.]